jgi:hypothetical protein
MARMVSARQLAGRRIVGFRPNPFDAEDTPHSRWAHDPTILLDDGSALYFVVEETEFGEYGVFVGKTKAKRKVTR